MKKKQYTKVKKIIGFTVLSFISAVVVMISHEAGHAAAALFCGAEITAFAFDHVDWGYAPLTYNQFAWLYLNGTLLPLIISLPFFWFPRKAAAGAVSFGVLIGGWFELYYWTAESFLLRSHSDVSRFILFSGAESSAVRTLSVLIFLIYSFEAFRKCAGILLDIFI